MIPFPISLVTRLVTPTCQNGAATGCIMLHAPQAVEQLLPRAVVSRRQTHGIGAAAREAGSKQRSGHAAAGFSGTFSRVASPRVPSDRLPSRPSKVHISVRDSTGGKQSIFRQAGGSAYAHVAPKYAGPVNQWKLGDSCHNSHKQLHHALSQVSPRGYHQHGRGGSSAREGDTAPPRPRRAELWSPQRSLLSHTDAEAWGWAEQEANHAVAPPPEAYWSNVRGVDASILANEQELATATNIDQVSTLRNWIVELDRERHAFPSVALYCEHKVNATLPSAQCLFCARVRVLFRARVDDRLYCRHASHSFVRPWRGRLTPSLTEYGQRRSAFCTPECSRL